MNDFVQNAYGNFLDVQKLLKRFSEENKMAKDTRYDISEYERLYIKNGCFERYFY